MDFVVLPDSQAASAVAESLTRATDVRVVHHASGRPWLMGRWADGELTLVGAGARRLAVLGRSTVDGPRVERALAQARSLGQLDDVARSLPGCFHLVASFDGWTRAQGSLSTARQIFHAEVGGVTVAADGPRRLAQWASTLRDDDGTLTVDHDLLALRLLTPSPPCPGRSPCARCGRGCRRSAWAAGWSWAPTAAPAKSAGGARRSPTYRRNRRPNAYVRHCSPVSERAPVPPSAPICPVAWTPPVSASWPTRRVPTSSPTTGNRRTGRTTTPSGPNAPHADSPAPGTASAPTGTAPAGTRRRALSTPATRRDRCPGPAPAVICGACSPPWPLMDRAATSWASEVTNCSASFPPPCGRWPAATRSAASPRSTASGSSTAGP